MKLEFQKYHLKNIMQEKIFIMQGEQERLEAEDQLRFIAEIQVRKNRDYTSEATLVLEYGGKFQRY